MYDAKIVADSISPAGVRLTTMTLTFPRIVLAEFNTHRTFSRNSQSSRARPLVRTIADVLEDPFVPELWGENQPGMQAGEPIEDEAAAEAVWRAAMADAVGHARALGALGVHKQLANRLLEPFMWHTVLCSATDWGNFFALRVHPAAQPEIQRVARMALGEYVSSVPRPVGLWGWHLPLLDEDEQVEAERDPEPWIPVSVGRCARVSYLTHDGVRDPAADVQLYQRLLASRHMSPFEHAAIPLSHAGGGESNFRGWHQHRKDIEDEANYAAALGVDDLADLLTR